MVVLIFWDKRVGGEVMSGFHSAYWAGSGFYDLAPFIVASIKANDLYGLKMEFFLQRSIECQVYSAVV